ncbi:MAG: hemolysin family protein [Gemmatimonadota bacterium]
MSGWILLVAGTLFAVLGVLSGSAASSVRRVDLYRWAAGKQAGSRAAASLLHAPDRIVRAAKALATMGVLVAGLGAAEMVQGLPLLLQLTGVLLVTVPLVLTFGYAVPRALGRRWPERLVRRTVPWMRRLARLLSPLSVRGIEGAGGDEFAEEPVTEPDDEGGQDELTALSGVLAFTERPLREVMTPRTEIVAVREGTPVDEIGRLFMESGYSRIPIYRESLDNIVGMIYAFDLLKITPGAELPVRPIATAPASKRSAELLFEMQRDRRQIAVVLDEFGGTAGMVTFEDLLEELVGEIFDEHDRLAQSGQPPAQLMEVSGATPVDEIEAKFEVALPDVAETVGGLLARLAGRIPSTGDRYAVSGLEFEVLSATPNRLERVLVRRGPVAVVRLAQAGES